MSVSKRDMLRGAAGLGVMATSARADSAQEMMPRHTSWFGRGETAQGCINPMEALDPLKQAAIAMAEEKMTRERDALRRKQRSLSRLRSVSPAWVEAQCEQLERQGMTITTPSANWPTETDP